MARKRRIPYKPDPFQRTVRAFYGGLSGAGWLVVAGVVSLVFVVVGLAFLSAALAEADDAGREELEQATTAEELEEVARDYRRSAGPAAYLRLGNMLFGEAQKAEDAEERRALFLRARQAYSKGAAVFPRHFLTAYLLEGEGLSLEEMKMYDEAVEAFKRATEADPKGHLFSKLEADIGRNLVLLGDEDGAVSYLESAVYESGWGQRGQEADWVLNARFLLAEIKSKKAAATPGDGAAKAKPPEADAGPAPQPEVPAAAEPEAEPPASEAPPQD